MIRTSTRPGMFAMSVVVKGNNVTHFTIANEGEAGYCFSGRKEHFPSLQVRPFPGHPAVGLGCTGGCTGCGCLLWLLSSQ